MGLNCSSVKDIESNEYLQRFCGPEAISQNDPLWNNLFSHSLPPVFTKDECVMLDGHTENLRIQFVMNNIVSKNFAALVQVFASRAKELTLSVQTGDSMFIWQAYNALSIIKQLSRYLVESIPEEEFATHFKTFVAKNGSLNGPVSHVLEDDGDTLELLMDTLVKIITEIPVRSLTYILHLESINTITTLLSGQMFWPVPAAKLAAFRAIMTGSPTSVAPLLTKALIQNYIDQVEPPNPLFQREDGGSLVIGMASGIWNILRKGVGFGRADDDSLDDYKQNTLANQSLNFLLILVNHCTTTSERDHINIYQHSLITLGNDAGVHNENASPIEELPLFKLNYSRLYEVICTKIDQDETTLLLYTLIHSNKGFRSYLMARSDIELLVLPMLKTVYNAPTSASHHIYMSLIIMLILSEDELFNHQVHDIMLKNITWYTERNLSEITLGGIIILVIIRTIQYNILKMRDKYLHTNCLAALANMSSKFRSLHPYVSQRLISLFETLAKRHGKLLKKLEDSATENGSHSASEQASETVQDINVLEEVIRMVLEILNSVLSHQLAHNKHLIYTLLYKKQVFDIFRNYDATQDLVYNLDLVINYFTARLGEEHKDLGVSEVMDRIHDGVRHWSPDILRKFPDLKFRYVEEEQPEEFFIPYIWSLLYKRSGLYWSPVNMSIFGAENEYMV